MAIQRPARLLVLAVFVLPLLVVWAPPAMAACTLDVVNKHTLTTGVFHGWERFFCQPPGNYRFNANTNHGHGNKYVALWHSDNSHMHCDVIGSGSVNAFCSDTVNNTNHDTFHEAPLQCGSLYGDGHGISCHTMEAIP